MSIFGTKKPCISIGTSIKTIASIVVSGTTTIGCNSHGLVTGDQVIIFGSSFNSAINSVWTILSYTANDFVIGNTASGTTQDGTFIKCYELTHCTIEYNDVVQPDQINHRSVITGVKSNTHLGDYGTWRVTERIWQYSSGRFAALYGLYHTNVYFFPHGIKPVKDASANMVTCYVKTFKPFYWNDKVNYDALILEIDANTYHDPTKLLL